jgi:hypothetical protein
MILYKYVLPERVDVLQKSLIRYTQPMLFNDPFESRPYFSFGSMDLIEQMSNRLIKEGKMSAGQFAEFKKGVESIGLEALDEVTRLLLWGTLAGGVGVLSLTEKPDNLLMWAHYAHSHEGFVIGFNCEHEYFAHPHKFDNEAREFRKVKYSTKRPHKVSSQFEADDLHFTKSIQWEYEQEWRVIRPFYHKKRAYVSEIIDAEPLPICLFAFPPSCVKSIILGYRAADRTKDNIQKAMKISIIM